MLPEPLQIALDLLIQFTGDGGGHRPSIVPYGIGALLWCGLLLIARFKYRPTDLPHEALLVLGFSFALGRELLMLSVKVLEAYSLVSLDHLHIVFPPAEHALSDISTVIVIAAYMLYLTSEEKFSRKYMYAGIASVMLVYFATFLWWANHIIADPTSKFGQTWCDWAFRTNASIWFAAGGIYLWRTTTGWTRNYVCLAITCFFLDDFLKLPDMALDEKYEAIFAPIRHAFFFLGALLLAYIFLRGHARSILKSYASLEMTIEERTKELAQANKHLFALANIDGLTGLSNRRCFDHDFSRMRASTLRSKGTITLMLVDIDFFKKVNDNYGHLAGDECLRVVSKAIASVFKRENDIVARFGGEEFVVAVSSKPLDVNPERAEMLRKKVEETTINFQGTDIKLTISMGVARLDSESRENAQSLINRADEALYKAKEGGRNQVCYADT